MSIQEIIKKRRTIKPMYFTGETVSDQDVREMLESADWAPTHKLTEPWRFVIFSGKAKTAFGRDHAEMYQKVIPQEKFSITKFEKLQTNANKSSHIIAIIMKRDSEERIPEIEEISAVACAVQNMMLVATEKNIAHIWSSGGMTFQPIMKEYLNLAPKDKVMGFLYLGISDLKPKSKRFIPLEEKIIWKS